MGVVAHVVLIACIAFVVFTLRATVTGFTLLGRLLWQPAWLKLTRLLIAPVAVRGQQFRHAVYTIIIMLPIKP
jgi:hypothetical protein